MRRALLTAALVATALVSLVPADAAERVDYASFARNVLPPGQSGSLAFPPTATDQLALYDGLTPKRGNVTAADLNRYFKSARFGPDGRVVRTVRPRPGLVIRRDRWEVPHVTGRTRSDVMFGAGWVTAEDRGLLMNLLRGPGRVAALDVPGLDAFALANSATAFTPSAATEARLAAQVALLRARGARGRRVIADVDAYVAGINAFNARQGYGIRPWSRNDVISVAALIGSVFGVGGGDETRSSLLLSALQARLGGADGVAVWNDLRQKQSGAAPTSVPARVGYDETTALGDGAVVLDDGSFRAQAPDAIAPAPRRHMSNALLLARSRSATGRPLFVAGPQTGHSFPQVLMELDLHGGGIDARGAAFPGISLYVLLGRGRDFAWSATSAGTDIVDTFAETLCGGDDLHYLHRGECREMTVLDAGTLQNRSGPDRRIVLRETVHGPVIGYATRGGTRVALTRMRSTRGREILSALTFADLNANVPTDARSFLRVASGLELTFNLLYADDRDIAIFSSGRLPLRAPGSDGGLATEGTGRHEWRGFLLAARHAQVVNPPGGAILNWNNRPAPGFAAADDEFSWGSIQRVQLLRRGIAARARHTLPTVVAAMNDAATQDLRAVLLWPTIAEVLAGSAAPSDRGARAAAAVTAWRAAGASRLDVDLDGRIGDPGAAVLDAAWPRLADAVLAPVLGPLTQRLAEVEARDDRPGPNGNAYGGGWYGYVDTDLRALLGRPGAAAFSRRYCGGGDLAGCRASLWAALDAAAADLAAAQGPDVAAWRSDATRERVTFGFLPATMRFANRPTFQQVVSFGGHRPRR